MKKFFLLILILASNLFGQEWNDIVTTSIEEPDRTDIFTNSSGIHILIKNPSSTNIVYYNLNSAGEIDEDKTETLETSGYFPNIIGSNDKIYAIYKTIDNNNDDVIRVKYSTDNGSSWLTNIADRPTTANYCNGVDAVYELGNGVHLVWATQDGGTSGFETYYYRLNTSDQWVEGKNVTDVTSYQYGGNPSVAVSPNRVHVSFNTDATTTLTGSGDVKTRDKFNGNWETPQSVITYPSEQQSLDERLLVRGDYLYLFYNREHPGAYPNDLVYKTRLVGGTSWSDFPPLESETLLQYEDTFEITKTTNDYIHIVYKKFIQGQGWLNTYKCFNGTNWSDPDYFDGNSVPLRQIGLSSVSNDLFCTWVKLSTPYLRFRQWDAAPLAPQNLTVVKSANNHPLLSWTKNNEPDVTQYKIYKKITAEWGWQYFNTVTGTSFEDLSESYPLPGQGGFTHYVYYKVTAVDLHPFESAYSNEVSAKVGGAYLDKSAEGISSTLIFSLDQNYPNPFNPSTVISYSIPFEGSVRLRVFNTLGEMVGELVNQTQTAGEYQTTFDAGNLASGMYFYSIEAVSSDGSQNLKEVKKMLLQK